jgi:hypothetical protein
MQPTMTEATMAALSRAVDDVAAALELINWAEMQKRQRQGLLAQWWQRGRDFAGQIINV